MKNEDKIQEVFKGVGNYKWEVCYSVYSKKEFYEAKDFIGDITWFDRGMEIQFEILKKVMKRMERKWENCYFTNLELLRFEKE